MKCKHENTTGYMWRTPIGVSVKYMPKRWEHAFTQPGDPTHHDRITCDICGAWLPLGPSNDSPEAVRVELRAAERAWRMRHVAASFRWNYIDETHCNCWFEDNGKCCRCGYSGPTETPCEVGILARAIVTHGGDT